MEAHQQKHASNNKKLNKNATLLVKCERFHPSITDQKYI